MWLSDAKAIGERLARSSSAPLGYNAVGGPMNGASPPREGGAGAPKPPPPANTAGDAPQAARKGAGGRNRPQARHTEPTETPKPKAGAASRTPGGEPPAPKQRARAARSPKGPATQRPKPGKARQTRPARQGPSAPTRGPRHGARGAATGSPRSRPGGRRGRR